MIVCPGRGAAFFMPLRCVRGTRTCYADIALADFT
jgi:hypothetical protein